MKAIGFVGGAIGDLVMQTPLIRQLNIENPQLHFTLGIGNKYKQAEPLFYYHPLINARKIWSSYDDWPHQTDLEYIKNSRFNIVYGPMAVHTDDYWYLKKHYVKEFGDMFNINVKDCQCFLNPYFGKLPDCDNIVTLSMFPSFDIGQKKSLSINQLEDLCVNIKKLNLIPVQLGGSYDTKLENAENPDLSLIDAAQLLYSSKLHLTCDTSFGWISSAYQHPTIGFYTNNLPYMSKQTSKNIQPINPNSYYFHRDNLLDLNTEEIILKIKEFIV